MVGEDDHVLRGSKWSARTSTCGEVVGEDEYVLGGRVGVY